MMRWRILALLFFARIGLGFQFQTVGSAGNGISAAYGLDNTEIGLMIGLFMAPGLFLAMPAGFSGRFLSDRLLAGLGLAALALGGAVSAMASEPGMIGVGRLICGAGFLFATLYFTKMVADWFEGREIATAMSILVMSWPFGIAMGQVGHTWLAELFGWQMPFIAASIYCACAALAIFALYRSPNSVQGAAIPRFTWLLPREWGLIACAAIAWAVFNAGYVIYLSFGPKMLEVQGAGVLTAASVISVGSWLMIVSGAACGQIVDRFGRREAILAICMMSAVAALLLLSQPGMGLVASLIFGLVGMAPAGVIMALAGQAVAPERRAFGMGVFFTVYYVIMTAIPPIAGWIFDWTGAPDGTIVLGAVLFALIPPVAILFQKLKATAQVELVQKRA